MVGLTVSATGTEGQRLWLTVSATGTEGVAYSECNRDRGWAFCECNRDRGTEVGAYLECNRNTWCGLL
jgi:hypothetical protein